ncbi:MAG: hypothetical protein F6K54_37860 [Okeania sp. SIO3B5]|uniref:hypothetical protein n=1 Tax=Okeania sp. SIO3B5 TaxID=2607811 RepID=UPI0013FEE27B|nr:hypothetical protein [Okeania sp. SIO3B5]NEO58312.1 hypothetical protein [Okeania sp. SIO3B5]
MNTDAMKSNINEIRSELNKVNYDNFADKNRRTFSPEKLTDDFSSLLDKLKELVTEALSKFPDAKVDKLFENGKKLLDVRKRPVGRDDLETGKEYFLQAIKMIEANLEEEKKTPELSFLNSSAKKYKSDKIIFISYYNEQILEEIQTVFATVREMREMELAPEMDNLKTNPRNQLNNLETISLRINEICSCSSAIICLPPENLQEESISALAYFDLGACLALFPKQTLLIHQGNKIPEDLKGNVANFLYHGNLDFKKGMELAREILKVLK